MPTQPAALFRIVLLAGLVLLAGAASAQVPPGMAAETAPAMPDTSALESPEGVRALVASLNDAQVRELLLARLDIEAERRAEAPASGVGALGAAIASGLSDLLPNLADRFVRMQRIPEYVAPPIARFAGDDPVGRTLLAAALFIGAIALGLVADRVARGAVAGQPIPPASGVDEPLASRLRTLARRLARELAGVAAFGVVGYVALQAAGKAAGDEAFTAALFFVALVTVRVIRAFSRFVFAPQRPDLRLCHADDWTARFLVRQFTVIASIAALGYPSLGWLYRFGMEPGGPGIGFWITLAMFGAVLYTLWRARDGIRAMVRGGGEMALAEDAWLVRKWPVLASSAVVALWVLIEIIVSTGNFAWLSMPGVYVTLIAIGFAPVFDSGLRGLAVALSAVRDDMTPAEEDAQRYTRRSLLKLGRVILVFVLIGILALLWGIDLTALASQGLGARAASVGVRLLAVALVAYGVWIFLDTWIERALAREAALAGPNAEAGEIGGTGGTRLETILPLARRTAQVAILAPTALIMLGEVGLDVTPLLAGAGIIGLAVGFGAQALVRDIVSGVFFLIDDAFRIGEYIETGETRGAVEKISLRSLRLRHHRGAVHTIPYGEITKLTNYSRDWVIMKLRFRVPFDTDVNKVKKIFKRIGQELLEHPELGEDFLQPFKSQGVLEIDDSAIVVRGKFMARPGRQFMIRKEIFVRVQQAFDDAGIEFARKAVIVQVDDVRPEGGSTTPEERARLAAAAAADAGDDGPEDAAPEPA